MWPFSAIREARRRSWAERFPVDEREWKKLAKSRPCLASLDPATDVSLRALAAAFLMEKRFLEAVPDEDGEYRYEEGDRIPSATRLAISAYACLPALALGLDALRTFETVIVAPDAYGLHRVEEDESGIVTEYFESVAGDSSDYGPLTVSARDVAMSGRGEGYNVVIHEIAHKLDLGNGAMDGAPALPARIDRLAWADAFREAWDDAVERAERDERRAKNRGRGRARESSLIDSYAATGPDEFFAVCLEYYYDDPDTLARAYPRVFGMLGDWLSVPTASEARGRGDSAR